MKRKNIIAFSVALMAIGAFTSCSDEFLQDKKNYDYVDASTYNTFSGAKARVDDIYAWCLPNTSSEPSWKYNSTGAADLQSKSTEEYSGFGSFVDPDAPMTSQSGNNTVPDYFHNSGNNIQASVWGRIRNCNDVIYGIENSTLSEEEKNELLGQVYFFRAWCYYNLVKWYGGVPIITEVQEPVAGAITPRSTTKACVDFICEDLERSAQLLAPFTENGGWPSSDFGRVTSGTALALKGRTLLLYASPLFNRKNDVERWRKAYNEITADLPRINACGYGLANESNAGANASGWANVFSMVDGNTEAVFVTLYNDIATGGVPDFSKNNSWEHGIRPSNAMGGGGKTPSAMMVDMFPMADGKRPSTCNTYSHFLTGIEIENMDETALKEAVKDTTLFSKLTPLQKTQIISLLQEQGNTVGFLGDGINDAGALRQSDIGISVDSAVDIAKESADIILLEKDLMVLEDGVLEGRKTFGNINKYIKMTASSNFGNMFSVVFASAFLPFLPMMPIHLLIQNLLYDISQTTIPFDRMDPEFLKKPRKWDASDLSRFMIYVGPISSIFDIITYLVMWYVFSCNSPEHQTLFQTGWFVEGLLSQTLIVHMIRTRKIPFIQSRATWPVMGLTFLIMAIGILIPFTAFGRSIGLTALPLSYFPWLIGILLSYCILTQIVKNWYIRKFVRWL